MTLTWILLAGALALVPLVLLVEHLADRKRVARLRRIPRSQIGGVPELTQARLAGEVKRHGIWRVAPISRRPCVYWCVRVYTRVRRGRYAYWELVTEASSEVPFVLDDGTGRALVDPSGADVSIKPSHERTARWSAMHDHEREWLAQVDVLPGRRTFRFEESVISIGQPLSVIGAGRCAPVSAEDPGTYRHLPAHWLHLNVATDPDLRLTDHPALLH